MISHVEVTLKLHRREGDDDLDWEKNKLLLMCHGFDVLLSSANGPAFSADRSIWLPGWLNANWNLLENSHFQASRTEGSKFQNVLGKRVLPPTLITPITSLSRMHSQELE